MPQANRVQCIVFKLLRRREEMFRIYQLLSPGAVQLQSNHMIVSHDHVVSDVDALIPIKVEQPPVPRCTFYG